MTLVFFLLIGSLSFAALFTLSLAAFANHTRERYNLQSAFIGFSAATLVAISAALYFYGQSTIDPASYTNVCWPLLLGAGFAVYKFIARWGKGPQCDELIPCT